MENKNRPKTMAESYHQIADRAEMRRRRSIMRSLRRNQRKKSEKLTTSLQNGVPKFSRWCTIIKFFILCFFFCFFMSRKMPPFANKPYMNIGRRYQPKNTSIPWV